MHERFVLYCARVGNPEWQQVYDYLFDLMYGEGDVSDVLRYAKHPNPSYPYKIYHPKVMIIIALYQNKKWKKEIAEIAKQHPALAEDEYYRQHF